MYSPVALSTATRYARRVELGRLVGLFTEGWLRPLLAVRAGDILA